jgi:hypothetical protein
VEDGRKVGSVENKNDLMKKYFRLIPDIRAGISLNKCMKIHDISKNTVIKLKRILAT